MEIDIKTRVEIEAIASIVDGLDYYQVLQVQKEAALPAIERGFASESKRFHPDRFLGVNDPEVTRKVARIYKKVAEAWSVLKDPELKAIYDRKLRAMPTEATPPSSPPPTIQKEELVQEREEERAGAQRVCTTRQGQKFYDIAMKARFSDDWNGVVMNLKFAADFEPGNDTIKAQLAEARIALDEHRKKTKNPYKIRIV